MLLCLTSCIHSVKSDVAQVGKDVGKSAIDCVKTEAALIKQNISKTDIYIDVIGTITTSLIKGEKLDAIAADLIQKYAPMLGQLAESFVACTVNELRNPPATAHPVLSSMSAELGPTLQELIDNRGWTFTAP